MSMRRASLAAAGLGAGMHLQALNRIATALYWPRTAAALTAALICGAALGAALHHLLAEEGETPAAGGAPWSMIAWTITMPCTLAFRAASVYLGWGA